MDEANGRTARVWIRGAAGPRRRLVMQVYDERRHEVGPPSEVRTRHDVIEAADRYGVALVRVTFVGDAARLVEDNTRPW